MSNKKILIVEDDADVRMGLHVRFKANHYDFFLCGRCFLQRDGSAQARAGFNPADLGLPAGDGFLVMERLKAVPALAMIPVDVVSGRSGAANRERALKAGAKAFLEKPVDNAELLAVIH